MLKILIVEDNHEKRRIIAKTALSVDGIDGESLEYASDVVSAKKAIKRTRFDLVILDINLPRTAESAVEVGAGIDVLKFIRNNNSAKPPAYLVGMTAFDDGADAAAAEFSSPLWKLVRFAFNDESWQKPLSEALTYLITSKRPPFITDGTNYHIDLGIFTALDEELQSILALDADWQKIPVPHDHGEYYQGCFNGPNGRLQVVVTVAPHMGMPSAAVTASKLIHNFRPRYLAITGICAGVRGKARLGDIIIADPCFDWGSGKWVAVSPQELKFRPAAYQWRLDDALRAMARKTATADALEKIRSAYPRNKTEYPPQVIIDAMASGASVLQSTALMDDVREQHKNLVGIEMESYAVFTAAQYAADPRPNCISIKSVCDFGDEHKTDDAHHYAAYTSANFLFELARNHLKEPEL